MKKIILPAFALLLCTNAYAFSGLGAGTSGNPYLIETCAHLQEIEDSQSSTYALTRDIDCDGFSFTPISSFSGTFNGYGWTISDLTISTSNPESGLFGKIESSGVVKNVTLEDVDIDGQWETGALAGESHGTVQDIAVSGTIDGSARVGGIIGFTFEQAIVERVYANVTVTCSSNLCAGIVGYGAGGVHINQAFSEGSATSTGNYQVSGITGYLTSDDEVVEGEFVVLKEGLIENSASTMDLTGGGMVGGIAGIMDSNSSIRYSTYGGGTITSTDTSSTGGITGDDGAAADVLASYYDDSITCNGCTNTIGQTDITNINEATLEPLGWDFDDIWFDDPGLTNELPQLRFHVHKFLTPQEGIYYPQFTDTPYFRFNVLAAGDLTYGGSCTGGLTSPSAGYHETIFSSLTPGTYTNCTIQLTTDSGSYLSNVLEVPPFTVVDTSLTGNGTTSTPYEVTDCYKLQSIQDNLSASYELAGDIDCSETSKWNFGEGFDPLGDDGEEFLGSLDGNDQTISSLTIDRSENFVGLFGKTDNATIQNLTLNQASISGTGGEYDEDIEGGDGALGGIVGYGLDTNIFNTSVQNTNITAEFGYIGAIIGELESRNGAWFKRNWSNADVTSTDEGYRIGGLIGLLDVYDSDVIVEESYSTGDVTTTGNRAGGLIGMLGAEGITKPTTITVRNTYAQGDISMDGSGGGLIGRLWPNEEGAYTSISIENSYASGNVVGDRYLGGLVGRVREVGDEGENSELHVSNSFSIGTLTQTGEGDNTGGLLGDINNSADLSKIFLKRNRWDLHISGVETCDADARLEVNSGCEGINADGTESGFFVNAENIPLDNWNFSNIWRLNKDTYPTLLMGSSLSIGRTSQSAKSDSGSGKGKTIRWKGMSRDDLQNFGGEITKHNFEEYYAKSKEQVARMNEGFQGSQKYMVNRWGEHVFAGYLAGRIGLERYPHRYQNIVRFGSGSLTKGRGIELQDEELMLASAPESIEDIIIREPSNQGWADEYQLAKDRFQRPEESDDLFASAPVPVEKVALETDQVETHKNQRDYYRKKGIVDRKRDTSMVKSSRMDATKDMDTVQIRFGGKSVDMSDYLRGSQSSLFGSPQKRSEQGAYFWMLIIGVCIIASVGLSYLFKRKEN